MKNVNLGDARAFTIEMWYKGDLKYCANWEHPLFKFNFADTSEVRILMPNAVDGVREARYQAVAFKPWGTLLSDFNSTALVF